MKKILIVFYLLISILLLNSYEKIVDWYNIEINTENLTFDGEYFYLDNVKIEKDKISHITFNLSNEKTDIKNNLLENIDPKELLKRADTLQKEFLDEPILVLSDIGIQKMNKDGSQYTRSRYSFKIMNESQLSRGVLSFYYIKGSYETNIIMARSISPDGKVSYLDKNDISYTTPKQGLESFSGRRDEKLINAVIPNVKVGSIIDYEYETFEPNPEDKNQFYVSWHFGGEHPVYESKVKFIIPDDKEFYWTAKNFEPFNNKPLISMDKGYKIYEFKRGKCSPIVMENYSPSLEEFYPAVFGSLFKDQTYLSGWLSKLMKERMVATEKMKQKVNELFYNANAKTEEEKVSVLYRFIQEYVFYRSIKTSLSSGFSGHPAKETFENRYGDCIDKSILFATLLGIAGIEAYPVIVNTNDNPRALYNEIGVITGNHAINEIHLKEKGERIIYLDSTSITYRYPAFRSDDQLIPAWNPILNTVREIQPLAPEYNTNNVIKSIILTRDGDGQVDSKTIYSGDYEAGIRAYLMQVKEIELRSMLSSIISKDYPGSVLKDFYYRNPLDYSDNLFLEYLYSSKNMAKKMGNYLVLSVPVKYDFDFISLDTRKLPIFFPTKEGKKNSIMILIPSGLKVKALPGKISINNDYFSYSGEYIIKENKIVFTDSYIRTATRISISEYKNFKAEILKIDRFIKIPIVFEKE